MLIEFPKNMCKSRDKSYPTDQKTSSILVLTFFLLPAVVGVATIIFTSKKAEKDFQLSLSRTWLDNFLCVKHTNKKTLRCSS